MSKCPCYRDEPNWLHERGVCWGTKEMEPCSCGGDESKCNFYEDLRRKAEREKAKLELDKTAIHKAAWDVVSGVMKTNCRETYSWHDDLMKITRRYVTMLDNARIDEMSQHFEVDASEIREYLKWKSRRVNVATNYDKVVTMTPEELAELCEDGCIPPERGKESWEKRCWGSEDEFPTPKEMCCKCWRKWLDEEVER